MKVLYMDNTEKVERYTYICSIIITVSSLIAACFYLVKGDMTQTLIEALSVVVFGVQALIMHKKYKNKKQ